MLITLPNAFGDAATNMAIDAALLESIPENIAAFRHYAWLEPTASFGYAQSYQDVLVELATGSDKTEADTQAKLTPAPPQESDAPHPTLVRRLTGGGIVDHRNDWTYALVLHRSLPCASAPATTLYQQIHHALSLSLNEKGIATRLAPCPHKCDPSDRTPATCATASQCFLRPAANDVLRPDGRKIAGAAMKRTRHALLIQGSLDRSSLPADFDFNTFHDDALPQLADALELATGELPDLRPLFRSECIEREKQRFVSMTWNKRR